MKKRISITDVFNLAEIGSTRKITSEGYLTGIAAITKVGVQLYSMRELGFDSDEEVGVYRPPETVFHPDTIESLKLKPITRAHPEENVIAVNHSRLSVGSLGEQVEPLDDVHLGSNFQMTDPPIIDGIMKEEIGELSLGYDCIIVSESGTYNGDDYKFRWEGPMMGNHLAVLEKGDGRCGDTVKILDDNGGKEVMIKKIAIKFLQDAGVPPERVVLFMADAKDDADVNMDELAKIMKPIQAADVDLTAVIPALAKQLEPTMQKMLKDPKFVGLIATAIAEGISASPAEGPAEPLPDADPEADPLDPDLEDAKDPEKEKETDSKIKDAANKRAILIVDATPFMPEGAKINDMSDREILEAAMKTLKIEDCKGKSDDHLRGQLAVIVSDRTKAGKSFDTKTLTVDTINDVTKPVTGLDAKNLPK